MHGGRGRTGVRHSGLETIDTALRGCRGLRRCRIGNGEPGNALRGAVLILLGVPLYLWRRGRRGPERGIGN